MKPRRIVVALSGGIDSAISAHLIRHKYPDAVLEAVFMNNWDARDEPALGGCTIDADFDSAFRTAKKTGIPLHRLNLTKEYWSTVFQPALRAYSSGVETPNPDIACNREIKFGKLMGWAKRERIDVLATGHYAQLYQDRPKQDNIVGQESMGPILLQQSRDLGKDQTYFLSQAPLGALKSAMFPVGALLKSEVRSIATSIGSDWLLRRPESMGICFVGPGKHRLSRTLQEYLPLEQRGPLMCLETGKVVGEHGGLSTLTIGQNARLASMKSRMYVARKDKPMNAIYLVDSLDHPSLNPHTIKIRGISWYSAPTGKMHVSIRSQDKLGVPVTSVSSELIELGSPVFAPAAGQYAALYKDVPGHDRRVLGASQYQALAGGCDCMRRWEEEEFEPLPIGLPGARRPIDDISSKMGQLGVGSSDEDDSSEKSSDDEDSLYKPEHACRYCGLSDTACVARCNGCSKWFCNHLSQSSGSHIVQHLVKARHKEISLHPDSPVGDAVLECYNCGCRNIFLLGFIPAKADTTVVLLCRTPCATMGGSGAETWDVESWQPLISNRALLSWLVKVPEEAALVRSRKVSTEHIHRLEEIWRTRPEATLDDMNQHSLGPDQQEDLLLPVRLRYSDAFEYQETMAPLIACEAEYDKQLKEGKRIEGVSVRWDTGLNGQQLAFFTFPRSSEEFRIALGDEIIIKHQHKGHIKINGFIVKNPLRSLATEELCVEVKHHLQVPLEDGANFMVEFVWKSTSYDRMHAALRQLAVDDTCMDLSIFKQLMGHEVENSTSTTSTLKGITNLSMNAPGLPALNHSQAHAVRAVMSRPLSLIQGPPGTGKTVTSATIVYHLASLNEGPVLVTAPSNVAVDHLTEKIHKTGLRVVRIAAKWREDVDTSVSFLSLHEQVRNNETKTELQRLIRLRETRGELSKVDQDKYLRLVRAAEQEILKSAQVICCTCVGAGDHRLKDYRFRAVVLDEATQAVEAEALIPIVHGARQVILIGDHRQLGPVIMDKKAAKAGLTQSLFERLMNLGGRPIRLQVQYRMHPCLSEFPSNSFYEGTLQNGVTVGDRARPALDFPWPSPDAPMMFLSCSAVEEISASGTSYLNRMEASQCEKIVTKFLRAGILPSQIGVITPYDGQRAFIQQHMQMTGALRKDLYVEVEVASVDAFQGREKDYIILSCVRSNDHQGIGFLSDARRLNVALTRAKYGMVILGNPRVLARHPLWYDLVMHFKNQGLLMEGSLAALNPSVLQLLKPRPSPHQSKLFGPYQVNKTALVSARDYHSAPPVTAESLTRSPFELPFFSQATMAAQSFLTQNKPLVEDEDEDQYETYSQYQ